MMFIVTDEKYNSGFEISEHNGKVQLIRAKQGNDGKVYQTWGDIEVAKETTKRLPVAVELGSREEAKANLEKVMRWLRQGEEVPF